MPAAIERRAAGKLSPRVFLLAAWIAGIGADRIDLLGGSGSFVLTPFLVLSPLLLLWELARFSIRGIPPRMALPRPAAAYALPACLFLLAVFVSVIASGDPAMSLKRFVLLAAQISLTALVVLILAADPRRGDILFLGACGGLLLSLLFDVAQLAYAAAPPAVSAGISGFIDVAPQVASAFLPRLSGCSSDNNRGGLLLVFYIFLIVRWGWRSRVGMPLLFAAVAMLVMTFSRSAIAAFLVAGAVHFWQRGSVNRVLAVAAITTATAVFLAGALLVAGGRSTAEDLRAMLVDRASLSERAPAERHLTLIRRGLAIAGESGKNLVAGIGYGISHTVLGEFFGESKYGNFHSLYVTLLVEAGIGSLAAFLLLYLPPLRRDNLFLSPAVAFLFFNLFYQLLAEPLLWLVVALSWMHASFAEGRRAECG